MQTTLERIPFNGLSKRFGIGHSSCDIEALSRFERDVVLDFLLYVLGLEQRNKLRAEYPRIYARLHRQSVSIIEVSRNGKGEGNGKA